MRLLAIDPGDVQSAYVIYDTDEGRPIEWDTLPNRGLLLRMGFFGECRGDAVAIEAIASYGMPVGKEVFETCVWIGRFVQRWASFSHVTPTMVYRRDVKLHLCHQGNAKDPNVRQALIDKFGPGKDRAIGKKASPGPLYGLTGDCWSALAVAVTASETN